MHCNTEPAELCIHWAAEAVLATMQVHKHKSHLFICPRTLNKESVKGSLQVQASHCTFPQQQGLLSITHRPPSCSSPLACYQAGYIPVGVPLFLIGWLERGGGVACELLYKHCCGPDRRARQLAVERKAAGGEVSTELFLQTINLQRRILIVGNGP